jgi:hypothetical protein
MSSGYSFVCPSMLFDELGMRSTPICPCCCCVSNSIGDMSSIGECTQLIVSPHNIASEKMGRTKPVIVWTANEVTIGTASRTNGMKKTLPAGVSGEKSPNPIQSACSLSWIEDLPMVTEVTIQA